MAAEIPTFIEFPEAGYYTMIFNWSDGFRVLNVWSWRQPWIYLGRLQWRPWCTGHNLGLAVAEPGVYPIRAIWYSGGRWCQPGVVKHCGW